MLEVQAMIGNGGAQKEAIRPDFNKSIIIDFAGARITSDAGFLLMREYSSDTQYHLGPVRCFGAISRKSDLVAIQPSVDRHPILPFADSAQIGEVN